MRGHLKRVGRCTVPGHGQGCCVTAEVRENCPSREQERRAFLREMEAETDEEMRTVMGGAYEVLYGESGRILREMPRLPA